MAIFLTTLYRHGEICASCFTTGMPCSQSGVYTHSPYLEIHILLLLAEYCSIFQFEVALTQKLAFNLHLS